MAREVRMVPENWVHPKKENGDYQPMFDRDYQSEFNDWLMKKEKWDKGYIEDWDNGGFKLKDEKYKNMPYEQWDGPAPDSRYYMPQWEDKERTHLMMYENTTEGTPKSPAFKTPEQLAKWLVDNKVSSFGSFTASYEEWLKITRGFQNTK